MKTGLIMKKIIAVVLFVCMVSTLANADNGVSVTLNGQEIEWVHGAKPYMDGAEIMLPLKKMIDVLGGTYQEIEAQGQQRKVAVLNSKGLLVIVGSKEYATTNIIELDEGFTYDEPKTHVTSSTSTIHLG